MALGSRQVQLFLLQNLRIVQNSSRLYQCMTILYFCIKLPFFSAFHLITWICLSHSSGIVCTKSYFKSIFKQTVVYLPQNPVCINNSNVRIELNMHSQKIQFHPRIFHICEEWSNALFFLSKYFYSQAQISLNILL